MNINIYIYIIRMCVSLYIHNNIQSTHIYSVNKNFYFGCNYRD